MARSRIKQPATPEVCPVCSEEVPRGALACPDCGADHSSGWRVDAAAYDGLDLPDEFDYEEFTRNEFGSAAKPSGISTIWWLTAIALIVLAALYFMLSR